MNIINMRNVYVANFIVKKKVAILFPPLFTDTSICNT